MKFEDPFAARLHTRAKGPACAVDRINDSMAGGRP